MTGGDILMQLQAAKAEGKRYGCLLADPPWPFATFVGNKVPQRAEEQHYETMTIEEISALPVEDVAADDAVLFLWFTWPILLGALEIIGAWGFTYKTCAFAWLKADVSTIDLFPDPKLADMTLGYWTRANSEICLLATRGKPKRLSAGVRQGIIEPRRQHSRKPDCVHARIEKLVGGPRLELFGRRQREGWDVTGNDVERFRAAQIAKEAV